MKIGISSKGRNMQSQVDPRFGRCAYFLIVQTDDMSIEVFKNENETIRSNAGIHSAKFLDKKGVKAVLTGYCGANAMDIFNDCGIQVITGQAGSINDVIQNCETYKIMDTTAFDASQKESLKHQTRGNNYNFKTPSRCMSGYQRGMRRRRRGDARETYEI